MNGLDGLQLFGAASWSVIKKEMSEPKIVSVVAELCWIVGVQTDVDEEVPPTRFELVEY